MTEAELVPGGIIHPTPQSAIKDWYYRALAVNTANPLKDLTLYWRIRPEIDYGYFHIHASNALYQMPTWKVYSRFLITDKQPVAAETVDATH